MNKEKVIVEIRGVGFINKGAELMLNAIQQEFDKEYSNVLYVVEVGYAQLADSNKREKLINNLLKANLGVRLSGSYKKIPLKVISKYLFPEFHNKIEVVKEKHINIILDASGFAFGDQWGVSFAQKRITKSIQKWSDEGKTIVLLPQAFGPFTEPELIQEVRKLIKYSDLIFARDPISYEYVSSIVPQASNIFPKPDFTNLLEPDLEHFKSIYENRVAIIPNFKMVTSKSNADGEKYFAMLESVIRNIYRNGIDPFFLMHEGKKDEEIAHLINSKLEKPLEIIWEQSAIGIKSIIGSSFAVVTSRFHGLVSALSQGVPCLATSWSHKYEMLLKDYDYAEGLLSLNSNEKQIRESLDLILEKTSNSELRLKLIKKAKEQKELTREMWKSIHNYLAANHEIR